MAEWPLPWTQEGSLSRGSQNVKPQLAALSLLEVFGALSPTSLFCCACEMRKSFSWQGNGDKWGRTSFIWGSVCAELAVITNFLSQLTQHFREALDMLFADLLFCAGSSSCCSLWLKSCGIYSWAFPGSPWSCGNVSCVSPSPDLWWEGWLCLKG